MQKIATEDKRALAKQFSRNQQDFDYLENDADEASSSYKRDTVLSRFMPTSRRLVQFSDGNVADPNAKIVYIDGAFDLFHVGHIEILKVSEFSLCDMHAFNAPYLWVCYCPLSDSQQIACLLRTDRQALPFSWLPLHLGLPQLHWAFEIVKSAPH